MIRAVSLIFLISSITSCIVFKKSTKSYSPEMVFVPGGTFVVGDIFEETDSDATPTHEMKLSPFYIGKYEVTFGQFDAFALEDKIPLPDDEGLGRGDRAVVNVT